ncbi:protein TIME FOR COFFEE-like [Rutidosis leptorrhynchoides]|uniref:protein TIME FOR COFFEE-like n=1 Tax=Rutidosis leptorrhynchoides TaxID=125765 RepID=UPI003A990790
MDRNREARRAAATNNHHHHHTNNISVPPNGLSSSSSRRRHRSNSLRNSPDGDGDGGAVKKDREMERASRSKRMMMMNSHGNRDTETEDTSEESVNDEEDEDDGNGSHTLHQLHHRKSFPPAANKVFRAVVPVTPALKASDEMIGVSVPRKARSASTKRSHEWISGGGVVGGGASTDQNHRHASPAPVAPLSPLSSSQVSVRKKMKVNGGGSKPRPPKPSSSKSSSSNPEELEIEIAEVLYGLMTQSQPPSKKEITSSIDNKSRVSSPISNSTTTPQNSTVVPKRKKPRQVSENHAGAQNNPVKTEVDHNNHHQYHQSPKTDSSGSAALVAFAAENGGSNGFTSLPRQQPSSAASSVLPHTVSDNEGKCDASIMLTKQEVEKEASAVGNCKYTDGVITTATLVTMTNSNAVNPEAESQKEEKFEIDLMAPPPQQRAPQESDDDIKFSDHKQMTAQESKNIKEDEKLRKSGMVETLSLTEENEMSKVGGVQESEELLKHAVNEELRIDFEKSSKDGASTVSGSSNKPLHQALKHQQLTAKPETHPEKTAQLSSMPIPMSGANWPPMGYAAPLQGVISMDGNTMPSGPIQPIFTQPRPKRCATHCYIARNIHYLQQFMKLNPFWPAASAPAPIFGAKPHNLNVMPSTNLPGNVPQASGLNIFSSHTVAKDKSSQPTTVLDSAQRKQPVLLQQAMPPVTHNNILHGPAFIFPFNQQQIVTASSSVRPGSSKAISTGISGVANSATVGVSTSTTAPALSFNYPNMSANETQYMAILQNNPYVFPVPAVGAPPNYRGNPHAQAMPMFNSSFYSSQMIHPSQIAHPAQQAAQQVAQQAPPTQSQKHLSSQSQQISQTHQNSSGSTSSSQKHLQAQQRLQPQQQGGCAAVNGGGIVNSASLHSSYLAVNDKNRSQQPSQHMNLPSQARNLEKEATGGEDSPSTAESRASRVANTMSVYGHNFALPVHSQNFPMMNPQRSNAAVNGNTNDKKQQHQQSQQPGLKRGGAESSSPQTFAMSFATMNGSTGPVAQNHAMTYQNTPESLRQNYHQMMTVPTSAASTHHSQPKKDFKVSEDTSRTAGHDSLTANEDRKSGAGLPGKSGQSITSGINSSSKNNINHGANNWSTRSPISNSVATGQTSHQLQAQMQQQQQQRQQVLHLQKQQQQQQQQQNLNARSKNKPSNGSAYPDHLITSQSSMANGKFPSSLSSFPLHTSNANSSPVQSPQWRNSVRGPGPTTSQVPSSLATSATSSLKNLQHHSHQTQQQQSSRPHQQSRTQSSFGTSSQKLLSTTSSSTSQIQQQQSQNQNQNPGSNSINQCSSATTSSMSKGGSGSPRTNTGSATTSGRPSQASSLSSSQAKNSPVGTQRSSSSILGYEKSQQPPHQQQQTLQQQQQQAQAHMFFTHPYMQVQQSQSQFQAQQRSGSPNMTAEYHLARKQQSSLEPQNHQTSTAMMSLSPHVTSANTATSDPAKAIAAATSNLKGVGVGLASHGAQYGAGPHLVPASFPQYAPVSVQAKPTEQKQPAGE